MISHFIPVDVSVYPQIVKTEAVEKRTSRMNAAKQQSRSREEVPSMDNILPTGSYLAMHSA